MNQKLEMNASQNKKIKFEELGLKNYLEAFEYQQSLMDEIIAIKIKNREKLCFLFTNRKTYGNMQSAYN